MRCHQRSAVGRGVWDDERLHQIHDRFDAMLAAQGHRPTSPGLPHVPWAGCGAAAEDRHAGASLLRQSTALACFGNA